MQIPTLIPTLVRAAATDAEFRRLVHATDRTLRGLARDLAAGTLDAANWQYRMFTTLAQMHARAGYHGRVRAGDRAPFDQDDVRFGQLAAEEEIPFLQAFAFDVMGDRYRREDGTLDAEKVSQRAELYANRLYGTANEALILVADEPLWEWRLGKQDNCEDCLELAANSPYRGAPPPVYPRDGRTKCLGNCGCVVIGANGLRTFAE